MPCFYVVLLALYPAYTNVIRGDPTQNSNPDDSLSVAPVFPTGVLWRRGQCHHSRGRHDDFASSISASLRTEKSSSQALTAGRRSAAAPAIRADGRPCGLGGYARSPSW